MVFSKKKNEPIYAELLDRICLLDYPPKTMLRESDLAGEFGTSRTPIRDVLLRLSLLGLVESRTGVGTFVTDIDYESYRCISEMRLKVAELIGEISPNNADEDDIATLEDLAVRARGQQKKFELKAYWRLNHEVHFVVRRLIGNSALCDLWDRYYYQTARVYYGVAARDAERTANLFVVEVDATLQAMRVNDIRAVGHIQCSFISMGMQRTNDALRLEA